MRVALLTRDCPTQHALAHRLAGVVEIVCIVKSRNIPRRVPSHRLHLFLGRLGNRTVGWPLTRAWFDVLQHYSARFQSFPEAPSTEVANVNDPATIRFLEEWRPDLVAVSSTNLVGKAIIDWANERRGIVNLHTGVSPFVKGGPNCTNWCLATNAFHLIGNTTMYLDRGIDSGAIIASERTVLDGEESLRELQLKVLEHGADLYARTVGRIASGSPTPGRSQDEVGQGHTYYTRDWTPLMMARALLNYRRHYNPRFLRSDAYKRAAEAVGLVRLGE